MIFNMYQKMIHFIQAKKVNIFTYKIRKEYVINNIYKQYYVCCICTVCNQIKMGVHAIFGPSDPILGAHISSICDALDIPYLDARIDSQTESLSKQYEYSKTNINDDSNYLPKISSLQNDHNKNIHREFTINLNPSQILVNYAIRDVMQFLNWSTVAILYERSVGMYKKLY